MAKKKKMHPTAYYANPNPGQGQKFYMTPDLKLHPISSPGGGPEGGGGHGNMPPSMLPDSDFKGYESGEDNRGRNRARLRAE